MIRWFAKNDIAANFLLVAILLGGAYMAFNKIPLEVQPTSDWGEVDIRMTYRGGSPQDVEENIVIPIDRALRDLSGIEEIKAHANRGAANFDIIPKDGVDLQELRDEVEARIDTITTFPPETERPRISVPNTSSWREVVTVAVTGDLSELELYEVAKQVQGDILDLPEVSRTDLRGSHPLEISIEADDEKLRDHGLSISDLATAIRNSSLALSAGTINTSAGPIQIRTSGQAYTREDYGNIIISSANGALLKISDLAHVSDGFEEKNNVLRFNGERSLMIDVLQGKNESAIKISDSIRRYIESSTQRFPQGITLSVWDDESIRIRGRLSTLGSSLLSGGILVLIILSVFLRPMLAFYVVLGIPVSFAGGLLLMPYFGMTANTMSIFGFIIVLGIVVDDAIVTGENIYSRLRDDLSPLDAAVLGTKQVATPVTFGVLTTIVAFIPLMFFEGYWQTWTSQIPPVVGAVLIFSLIESKFILPSHLKHLRTHRDLNKLGLFARGQKWVADGLERLVTIIYTPALRLAVAQRYTTIAIFFALGFATIGLKAGGHLGFQAIPTIERYVIDARLDMLDNTPFAQTDAAVQEVEAAARKLQEKLIDPGNGEALIRNIKADVGSGRYGRGVDPERGSVSIEILPPSLRSEPGPTNTEIEKLWKNEIGEIANLNNLYIRGSFGGRRSGGEETEALKIQLRGPESEKKSLIADQLETLFDKHPNINWAHADKPSSREEMVITLKPRAQELEITQRQLAQQVRQAFFGEEVQRIQRDGDELRVMVRLPGLKRENLHTFDTLNIQAPDGTNVPFGTVAEVSLQSTPSRITLINGAQVSDVTATPKDSSIDILALAAELEPQIHTIVNQDPSISWIWEGFIKEDRETGQRSTWLFGALILALYALLAIPFRSLLQPLVVLLAVPFGVIGAYAGHLILGIVPSWLSVFGIMALAGVVVNDSIVLVDFINKKREEGMELNQAVLSSGVQRFRPIFLTSITTFAGLMPLMFDRAIHAQFLKPMAVSLGFGILFATFITLFLIPASYLLLEDLKTLTRLSARWYMKPFRKEGRS